MNKQFKIVDGIKINNSIEWTDYTHNPISGCKHGCAWIMPNGQTANCYAEDVANGLASAAYPDGFEAHYWHPDRLNEPLGVKESSRIFVGSMADVFGWWVPAEQIRQVLAVCKKADWHQHQFLTKNPRRVLEFRDEIPENCWIGASTPPDIFWNKPLSRHKQEAMLLSTLEVFDRLPWDCIKWLSAEPLSWDITEVLERYAAQNHGVPIRWIVIGAASNGKEKYPPKDEHIQRLVDFCKRQSIMVFYKGNMRASAWASQHWYEQFPR